jgi:hypothetical protein
MLTKLEAAAIYAGANILILLVLAFLVVSARRRHKVTIGDGGNPELARAMRAHANAAEYIPAILVGLMFLALLDAAPIWLVHATGALLTVGRVLHGIGFSQKDGASAGRALGILATWLAMLLTGGALIYGGLAPLLG